MGECGSARYGRGVELDIGTRTQIMGVAESSDGAVGLDAMAAERPALIAVHNEAQLGLALEFFDGPVVVRTAQAAVADRCLRAGAAAVHDPSGFSDPSYLDVVEEAHATVIVSCPDGVGEAAAFLTERSHWAQAAGVDARHVVVDATPATAEERKVLARLGHPLLADAGQEADKAGHQVLHAIDGVAIIAVPAITCAALGARSTPSRNSSTADW